MSDEKQKFLEYHRTESGEYKCPHCDYVKKNQSTVHMHIKAKHYGTYKHKCSTCDYEASTKQILERHIEAKHSSTKKGFTCLCGYECRQKSQLRSHYLLKHFAEETNDLMEKQKDKIVECKECHELFKSKPAFVYHVPKCFSTAMKEALGKELRELLGCD